MADKYKLTIAIPTYNRLDKLKICLDRLFMQDKVQKIEIIISDNASQDGTRQYMEKLVQNNSNIYYYRNEKNVGPDRNFLNCYNRANGEYILLLGDDDYLLPHAVDKLLKTLEKQPIFVHLNTCGIDCEQPFIVGQPRWKENGLKIYQDRNDILKEIGIYITFMSSLVLKTDLVKQISDKERFIGTYFIQSYIALCTMKEQGTYIIDTFNYLAASGNEKIGYDLYEVWFFNYHKLLMEGGKIADFSEKTLSEVFYSSLKGMIKGFVVRFRCSCENQKKWKKKYIWQSLQDYPDMKIIFAALVYCPVRILKMVYGIMQFMKKIVKGMLKGTVYG